MPAAEVIDPRAAAVAQIGWEASRLLRVTGSPDLEGAIDLTELRTAVERLAEAIRPVEYHYLHDEQPEDFREIGGPVLDNLIVLRLAIETAVADPQRDMLNVGHADSLCHGVAATLAEKVLAWAGRHAPAEVVRA